LLPDIESKEGGADGQVTCGVATGRWRDHRATVASASRRPKALEQ
jgi:hypothetical protein